MLSKPVEGSQTDLLVHHLHGGCARAPEEPAIAEYLATEFPNGSLPAGLAKLIYRHSGGNALFMVEIVQDIVKKGLIAQARGTWMLTKPLKDIDPGVPETLQQMLDLQFSHLSAEEQRILNSGSVVGERFSVWAVRPTLDIETDRIEDLLEGLAENNSLSGPQDFRNSQMARFRLTMNLNILCSGRFSTAVCLA